MRHSRVVIWSSLLRPAMDCLRNERISGAQDGSSANCHPKPEMGADSDHLVGLAKGVAECNFNRRNVRLYRSGISAQPNVGCLPQDLLGYRRDWRTTAADGKHAGWHGRT